MVVNIISERVRLFFFRFLFYIFKAAVGLVDFLLDFIAFYILANSPAAVSTESPYFSIDDFSCEGAMLIVSTVTLLAKTR